MNIHPNNFEDAHMVYIDPDTGVVFMWAGGYIDAGHFDTDGQFLAVECIDFPSSDGYDHGPTVRQFQEACTEFLAMDEEEEEEEEEDWDDDECCGGACNENEDEDN